MAILTMSFQASPSSCSFNFVASSSSPALKHHLSPKCSSLLPSTRRTCVLTSLILPTILHTSTAPANSVEKPPIPDYPPKTPLIEKLLERSRANKAKYDQDRLDDYYERNFKDYFEFVEGTIRNKKDLTETEKGILKWLDRTRNKSK